MSLAGKQLVLAIDFDFVQLENLVAFTDEMHPGISYHSASSSDYIANTPLPEPDLLLINVQQTESQSSGLIEVISESPHPIILVHPTSSCCANWWLPSYPQLRDCLIDQDVEKLATAVVREVETLELKHQLKERQFHLNNLSHGLNSIVSEGNEAAILIQNGKCLKANIAFHKLFGTLEDGSLRGKSVPEQLAILEQTETQGIPSSNQTNARVQLKRSNGESFHADLLSFPVLIKARWALQIIIRNPTVAFEGVEVDPNLYHKDELTGLINRQFFLEQLAKQVVTGTNKTKGGLALVLIDRFKTVREEQGILNSDQILAKVAKLIEGLCDSKALVARFGDAVFALYSSRLDENSLAKLAEDIRTNIAETLFESGENFNQITCSVGTSLWNNQVSDIQEMISRADQACEKATKQGGNKVILYHNLAIPLDAAGDEQQKANEISLAMEENRFRLIYQPIVHLNGEDSECYAVLLRMIDSSGKHVPPDRFIHLAEKTGLIFKLDKWVVHQTCLLIKRAQIRSIKRLFFVKLSGESLNNKNFLPHLYACIRDTGIKGETLVFQIDYAESRIRPAALKNFVIGIKKAHCQFAFDHFGFGKFRSMDLQDLPIDYLKIDGVFVRSLLSDPKNRETISRIISTAKPLNIKTIAKSVENANTLAALWNLGVDAVQGYFLQEPSENMKFDFTYNE